MKTKSVIALSLLLLIVSGCFFSCAEDSDAKTKETTDTTAITEDESTSDENPEPSLPEYNGEGGNFTFLIRMTGYDYDEKYVYTEEFDGEIINDKILERNRSVEDKFNILINGVENKDVTSTIRNSIVSDEHVYDVIYESKNAMTGLINSGYFINFHTLPNVTLDAKYWEKNAMEQLTVAGKLYFMASDISMQNMSGARLLYFNKKLIEDYNLPNPYEKVYTNTWTLDVVLNMISSVSDDLNGDGIMDKEDQFGILAEGGESNSNIQYFLKGSGIRNTVNDENGIPQLAFMTEKTVKVMEMCKEVLDNKDYAITYEQVSKGASIQGYAHYFDYCRGALFTTDHFLFVQNGIGVTQTFKDMESDYGITPNPKYDSAQENYSHRLDPYTTSMALPITNLDLERTGIILEYMSWLSSKTVLPAYYETTIKTKRMRDEDSPVMLDIIKGSITYEISDIFDLGISSVIWTGYTTGNLASTYDKYLKSMTAKLNKLIDTFEKND